MRRVDEQDISCLEDRELLVANVLNFLCHKQKLIVIMMFRRYQFQEQRWLRIHDDVIDAPAELSSFMSRSAAEEYPEPISTTRFGWIVRIMQ